ncbi:brain mitochondrial carrier protein 1-like [Styela clava]|uniref:brain mitochondrial carrier protein 1-like n=1 Tax=Styela clava TaxID=7725 RepID=UPI00193AAAD0|nr:brain mitochondrial carrier protein 1-like [Styela clava]
MASWPSVKPFIQGGISSVLAEVATFPLDLTKTRLQIQGQVIESKHKQIRYRGVAHALGKILQEEGFLAMYSGLGPAAARQLIYGGLKRGLYRTFQNWSGVRGARSTILMDLVLASSSGAISAFVCNPVDIVKVRMQSQGITFTSCYRQLLYVDGIKGLFRGVYPNVMRTAVLVGFSFSVYDEVKRLILYDLGIREGFYSYILASCIASITGSFAANPFDVIKSRMMNQKMDGIRYRSTFDCFIKTVKLEGSSALLKGYGTMLCRTVPWHTVFFLANEYMWR